MAKVGRPKGSTKSPTITYYRRVQPRWVKILDKLLNELRRKEKEYLENITIEKYCQIGGILNKGAN